MTETEAPVLLDCPHPDYIQIPYLDTWVFVYDLHVLFEVIAEISDEKFFGQPHGRRHVRNKGCTGPLCKKALRDFMREHRGAPEAKSNRGRPRVERHDELLARLMNAYGQLFRMVQDQRRRPNPDASAETGSLLMGNLI